MADKPSESGDMAERDGKGRFLKGHKGYKDMKDPIRAKRKQLIDALVAAVSPADIQAIAKRLVKDAKGGDKPATHELLNRCMGKARQQIDVDGNVEFRLILGRPER